MVPTICTEKTYSHFPPHHLHKKTSLIHSDSTLWWQPSWILPYLILPSLIQPFCTKLRFKLIQFDSNSFIFIQLDDGSHLGFIHFAQKKLPILILNQTEIGSLLEFYHLGFSHFAQKKISHSFWLNLMMAAILNLAILDSVILHKKNISHSFWLNLMMAAILNSAMWDSAILHKTLTQTYSFSLNLIMAAIFNSAILDSPIFLKTLTQTNSIWTNWFILSQLDDGSLLQFGHLGFNHLSFSSHTHSHLPRMVPTICTEKTYSHFPPHHLHKKTSLIHSDSTLWWQPSWILPYLILPSLIQPFCTKLRFKLIQFDSNSFIFIQLDDGSHLGFSHFAKKNFSHSFWLNLMMAAILYSTMLNSDTAILDSDTLLSSVRFTQKHSHSTLTLIQTNSIWLKHIHSHLTWWWKPSSIWPSWIQPS